MEEKKKPEPMVVVYRCLDCGALFPEEQGSRARFCLECRDKHIRSGKKARKKEEIVK